MRVPTLKSLATQGINSLSSGVYQSLAPDLLPFALTVVYNNIGLLNDVGTAPYSLVRTFLFRLTVNQLLEVERNSPVRGCFKFWPLPTLTSS